MTLERMVTPLNYGSPGKVNNFLVDRMVYLVVIIGSLIPCYPVAAMMVEDDYDFRGSEPLSFSSTPRDISLWIDERQVREFSDAQMKIYAIRDGKVLPYILDPNFQSYLPVVPPEVVSVNFTWSSGEGKRYRYIFEELASFNGTILSEPMISISREGDIPREPSVFHVKILCKGSVPGTATFSLRLGIRHAHGGYLEGTPIRLRLKKQCAGLQSNDSKCNAKCKNGGWCNQGSTCTCPKGYLGQYCETALCYPQCMNGGRCIAPGVCDCVQGYQGPHCEGGICREKCLNGGKCDQKDTCSCRRGYYGPRCEYSKCLIPCLNGGRCVGVDKCRCRKGFSGPQCELLHQRVNNGRRNKKTGKKKFV